MKNRKLPVCPVCGKKYKGFPAISRRDDKTAICSQCGIVEAFEDFARSWNSKQAGK